MGQAFLFESLRIVPLCLISHYLAYLAVLKRELIELRKINKHKSQFSARGFSEPVLDDNILNCLTCMPLLTRDNCKNMVKHLRVPSLFIVKK